VRVVGLSSDSDLELPDGIQTENLGLLDEREMVFFYRSCDVFVFTSRLEGFGLPPLEAMACGVPVVTTNCGGVTDFVDGRNALIVPPEPKSISKAIEMVLTSPELSDRLARQGAISARKLNLKAQKSGYVDTFRSWFEAH
jgi:glycosyltransferase involved in cell wall biosynthesis